MDYEELSFEDQAAPPPDNWKISMGKDTILGSYKSEKRYEIEVYKSSKQVGYRIIEDVGTIAELGSQLHIWASTSLSSRDAKPILQEALKKFV